MKALVVDDVGYSRLIVQKALEQMDVEVLRASSGAEALCLLQEELAIDLVISDLMMPDMDGIELIEEARKLEPTSEHETSFPPPFVLLTASLTEGLLAKARNAGFIEIMVKPLDPERLRHVIDGYSADNADDGATKSLDYAAVLKSVETTVAAAIENQDQDAMWKIRDRLQAEIVRINSCLEKLAKEDET